jgi:CheY-like chemotaxis protein
MPTETIAQVLDLEQLSGKRIALIGFSSEQSDQLAAIFERVDAFCRIVSTKDVGGGSLRAFDLAVLRINPGEIAQFLSDEEAAGRIPFLLIGSSSDVQRNCQVLRNKTNDFVLADTWSPDELSLRALKLVLSTGGTQKQASKSGTPKLIIADDDASITSLLNVTLKKLGYDCHVVTDGGKAVDLAKQLHPDLMILDVNMPHRDGFEVLSILRQDPETASIRILLLTAMEQEQDVLRGFGLGADDYVIKPFNPMEIRARVQRLLNVSK